MTFIEVYNLFTKFFVITAAGAAQYLQRGSGYTQEEGLTPGSAPLEHN